METRRQRWTYAALAVVGIALIGWLIARAVTKQRLIRALSSNDMTVRVEAARRLLEAEKLVDAMPAQPIIRRSKTAEALGEIGTDDAIRALGVLLQDQEEAPKVWARRALQKQGRRAVPVLMSALPVGGATKDEAVKALEKLGPAGAPQIRFLLTDRAAYKGAAEALSRMGEPGIQSLLDGSYTVDKDLRKQTLNNLGKQSVKPAVPAALDNLKPGKASAVGNAIAALGLIGDRTVVPELIPFLTNKDNRLTAVTALGLLRDPRAVDPILATMTDTEKAYRDGAILALRRIGLRALPALMRDLKAPHPLLRRAAASGMVGINSPAANSALAAALKDPDAEVRASAALAFGWEGNIPAVPPLVTALSDPEWRVVDAAVEGLGAIGVQAIPPLLAVLNDPAEDVTVNYQVAMALSRMGRPAVPSLLSALSLPQPRAQKWVAVALGGIGDARAVEPLQKLAEAATGDLKWVAEEQLRLLVGL